jgi:hypothetical protein
VQSTTDLYYINPWFMIQLAWCTIFWECLFADTNTSEIVESYVHSKAFKLFMLEHYVELHRFISFIFFVLVMLKSKQFLINQYLSISYYAAVCRNYRILTFLKLIRYISRDIDITGISKIVRFNCLVNTVRQFSLFRIKRKW